MIQGRAEQLFDEFVRDGETAIDRFIEQEISEELYVDYKTSASVDSGVKLHPSDRESLSKALSGFGNSEGGVIVWGVVCRRDPLRGDIPSEKQPIQNVRRFVSLLEGTTSGCTLPPHEGARHHALQSTPDGSGFVVSLVRKSLFSPLQCLVGRYRDRFYVRIGSNFEMASHGLLAGMFGRRPLPTVFHMWRCDGAVSPDSYAPLITDRPTATPFVACEVIIRNHGASVVRDVYANLRVQIPGLNCKFELDPRASSPAVWSHHSSVGGIHAISDDRFRLAPAAMVVPIAFKIFFVAPFIRALEWELSFGCEGSQVHRVMCSISPDEVAMHVDRFVAGDRSANERHIFARAVLGLEPKDVNTLGE